MAISLDEFHPLTYESCVAPELRLLYQLFEEAQRSRIAHGERLRAILQGRSASALATRTNDAGALLKALARGETVGAPRFLEHVYLRAIEDEKAAAAELREAIEKHPRLAMARRHQGHRASPRRAFAVSARCHTRGDPISVLGVLRIGNDPGRCIQVLAMQAGSRVSGGLSGARGALHALRYARVHGPAPACWR